jgi:hypothetical protein
MVELKADMKAPKWVGLWVDQLDRMKVDPWVERMAADWEN